VSVRGEVHGFEFGIELSKIDDHQVMMRSSFRSSPVCGKPEKMTCAAIDARDVQSLVDEVGEINRVISRRLADRRAAELFYF
jgi:hypothetical protein